MSSDLLTRPVVPVAGLEDAGTTYKTLLGHTDPEDCRPLVIHVIGEADGRGSIDQQEQRGQEAFEAFESCAAADGMAVETELCHGGPIAETIIKAAREADGSAIVFCSRGGSAWFDLLAGGVRTSLIAKSDIPVVMLPTDEA